MIVSRCSRAALLMLGVLAGVATLPAVLHAQESNVSPSRNVHAADVHETKQARRHDRAPRAGAPLGAGAWARVPEREAATTIPPHESAGTEHAPEHELSPPPRVQHEPVNAEPWSYVPAPEHGHCLQTYRLYLPPAPHVRPADGWPVVVQVKLSGYRQTPDTPVLDDASFLADLLRVGIAVVVARVTPSLDTDDPLWFRTCDGTLPDIPGHGLFHPPGSIPPDLADVGIVPYASHDYAMPEKDAVMLLQHVRYSARQGLDGDRTRLQVGQRHPNNEERDAAMAQLDHRMIGVHGVSAGGMSLMWAALGPDRRDEAPFAGRTGQWAETSRPDIAAFERSAVWWPAFHEDVRPPTPHFGMYGHSTLPAQTLGACSVEDLVAASPLAYGDSEWIERLPLYLLYDEPSASSSYEPDAAGCAPLPFCYPDQGLEGAGMDQPLSDTGRRMGMHPAWSGYAWKARYPHTRLAITDPEAYAQRGPVDAVPLFRQPGAPDAGRRDLVEWFALQFLARRRQLETQHDRTGEGEHWQDLGQGLAGSRGVPRLSAVFEPGSEPGSEARASDGLVTLILTGALEHARVVLLAGPRPRYASLAGGLVVPLPTVVDASHRTDASGGLTVRLSPSDAGGSGVIQVLVVDPGAPRGYAFSNALTLRSQDQPPSTATGAR